MKAIRKLMHDVCIETERDQSFSLPFRSFTAVLASLFGIGTLILTIIKLSEDNDIKPLLVLIVSIAILPLLCLYYTANLVDINPRSPFFSRRSVKWLFAFIVVMTVCIPLLVVIGIRIYNNNDDNNNLNEILSICIFIFATLLLCSVCGAYRALRAYVLTRMHKQSQVERSENIDYDYQSPVNILTTMTSSSKSTGTSSLPVSPIEMKSI